MHANEPHTSSIVLVILQDKTRQGTCSPAGQVHSAGRVPGCFRFQDGPHSERAGGHGPGWTVQGLVAGPVLGWLAPCRPLVAAGGWGPWPLAAPTALEACPGLHPHSPPQAWLDLHRSQHSQRPPIKNQLLGSSIAVKLAFCLLPKWACDLAWTGQVPVQRDNVTSTLQECHFDWSSWAPTIVSITIFKT